MFQNCMWPNLYVKVSAQYLRVSSLQVQQHPSDVLQQGSGEPSNTQAATLQV